jgi:hypothetical protein
MAPQRGFSRTVNLLLVDCDIPAGVAGFRLVVTGMWIGWWWSFLSLFRIKLS